MLSNLATIWWLGQQNDTYLACGFNSFPYAEVNNDPGGKEAQRHLIVDSTRFMEPARQMENFTSVSKKKSGIALSKFEIGDAGISTDANESKCDILPEFHDWGAHASCLHAAVKEWQVWGQVLSNRWVNTVAVAVAAEVDCAIGGVPSVATGGPRKWVGERVEEKVETPHQNHDVVGVAEEHNHHWRQAQTWSGEHSLGHQWITWHPLRTLPVWHWAVTFEKWCDVPGGNTSLLHELPQCDFQKEDWDTPDEHYQQVGDEEHTCNRKQQMVT